MAYLLKLFLLAATVIVIAGECESDGNERKYNIYMVDTTFEASGDCFGESNMLVEEADDGEMKMNGNINIIKNLPHGCQIQVTGDKLEQNTWQTNLRQQPQSAQTYIDSNKCLIKQLRDASNMTEKFPMEMGNVIITDFVPQKDAFPADLKADQWRIVIEILDATNKKILIWAITVRVEYPN